MEMCWEQDNKKKRKKFFFSLSRKKKEEQQKEIELQCQIEISRVAGGRSFSLSGDAETRWPLRGH